MTILPPFTDGHAVYYGGGKRTLTKAEDLLADIDSTLVALRSALKSQSRLTLVSDVLIVADSTIMDRYCVAAQNDLESAVCLVTLLDVDRQSLTGVAGVDREAVGDSLSVDDSMCQYVAATGEPLQVDDTAVFYSMTPGITRLGDVNLHSYYGEPIQVSGEVVGTFCAFDAEVRHWSVADRNMVRAWADIVEHWFQDALA